MDSDNIKISQLTTGAPVATDVIPYVSDPGGTPVTKKMLIGGIAGVGFSAHQTAAQTGIVTGTNTVAIFETQMADVPADYYNTTTGKYTPLIAGTYRFTAAISLGSLGDGKAIWVALRKNGSAALLYWGAAQVIGGSSSPQGNASKMFYMDGVDDYVEAIIWHNHGSNLSTSPGSAAVGWICWFEGNLIAPIDICGA